jgi:hypothetical protein
MSVAFFPFSNGEKENRPLTFLRFAPQDSFLALVGRFRHLKRLQTCLSSLSFPLQPALTATSYSNLVPFEPDPPVMHPPQRRCPYLFLPTDQPLQHKGQRKVSVVEAAKELLSEVLPLMAKIEVGTLKAGERGELWNWKEEAW